MRALLAAPTQRGRAALLLGAVLVGLGAVFSYPPVLGAGIALLLLVAAETLAVLVGTDPEVERTLTARVVTRGEPCGSQLRARLRRPPRLVDLVLAELVDGVRTPAEGADASCVVPTHRRGVVQVGPLLVRRVSHLRLAERTTPSGGVEEVRVLPRLQHLHALPDGRRRALAGTADRVENGGTDLVGLHEYVIGDDLRRLHWATTARTGTLMVREDADPADAHLLVLLDDRRESYPDLEGSEGEDRFEEAVEMAYAVCHAASQAGRPVHLISVSGRADVDVASAPTNGGGATTRGAELAMVLAGIEPVAAHGAPVSLPHRDLDVVVAVTGEEQVGRSLAAACGAAAATVVVCVEPAQEKVAGLGGAIAIRVEDAEGFVALWERAVAR